VGQTLLDKLWERHLVAGLGDGTDMIYIDRILLHERTGSIALKALAESGRSVRTPRQSFVCMDHIVETRPGFAEETAVPGGGAFLSETREAARDAGISLFDLGDARQGIVHVVAPEQGISLPGLTVICPDSHTCTQGGIGSLAWGIGSSEAEHALATSTLVLRRPGTMRIRVNGRLGKAVAAKDLMLHIIACHGAGGAAGFAIEFAGPVIDALSIEARMTLCNMAVEFAAWTAFCPPDEKTIDWLADRPFAPKGAAWTAAVADWRTLASDGDAAFDREITIDGDSVAPMVTWGTSPQDALPIGGAVPDPAGTEDTAKRGAMQRALDYMALVPGTRLETLPIEAAFIGSCTNSRLTDLRVAADILRGRHVAPGVRAICVPGSMQVRAAAEREGIDRVFVDAGFEWRNAGCAFCFFAGGEHLGEGARVVSSTNRNFENRQGPGTRSHLASPATVAASAVLGHLADPRQFAI
jgi:3-isopropylmalate/(R)-2-methylmalate dehydratase large subunit